ncbi:1-acyl-sn-glycerol-3-phosphate acyltransferase [Sulfitobacter mediterraneus]|uniref:lysophospholipid acyltransferase family protein n=1 Tax=Sulfitobacter mediterraneus TaxID=83219 RepID=UPI0019334514|nr:lysophospholipid acyltransferase family protein [Sulfitobacter mediterraneus]MBM1311422.1 1-acyl-sn-glycerol-3-phosphate acyltransferase [Sulfitobacter mediterraneus]MBM1315304.1 1-acyl-sn-glycerol-3-phosphate acyltransferase [Sulfitobacter mediterraneus]MBM1323665.1 1-acyl-sn-glycerol-3-phosphate acyltransferase [Sulfitobacter mediterraneus]MBM1327577.1 1-acyl-sn-glycerol-3-phosphate acyltransferase [Sulfitobacter mediterraneus]MBM1398925.1 1-acyl-sn-glycerol-3-phosphate acyltransferase [S
MLQWVRSIIYIIQVTIAMPIIGLAFAPWAMFSKAGAYKACKTYAGYAMWSARWLIGLRSEVRGEVPQGEVLVAAKHQSFLDIIMIFHALPRAKFIMKREIHWTPVIGQYTKRMEMIAVDRGKRGKAIAKMIEDVNAGRMEGGQLVIYSQGTRVAPGAHIPYKVGTAVLYGQLGQPCVPVATNAGYFWPRRGLYRRPGVAVVEFLTPIEAGLTKEAFMAELETRVERASEDLLLEAGWRRPDV